MGIKYENQPEQYVGQVLCDREENGYDDSDFYAMVWDPTMPGDKPHRMGGLRKVVYASTRCAGGGYCTVDATPEVKAAAAKHMRRNLLHSKYMYV